MRILILLAILYLVNARYTRNRRCNENMNRKEMYTIIELLQEISNHLKRPPPHLVYVPYPIVLNGKATPDLDLSSMKEDTAHNDETDDNNMQLRFSKEDSTTNWGLIEKEKEDMIPQDQITDASRENDIFLIDTDQNWRKYDDKEDSASPASEETVASKTSDNDGGRPVNLDPVIPPELLLTAPSVEHGSNQAGLDFNSEAFQEVEAEGSKQKVESVKKLEYVCTLAILACCNEDESKVESCFEMFECSKVYAPGITCLKHVTSDALNIFKEHIMPKFIN